MGEARENVRGIVKRVVVTGRLVLETPVHLGNGDSDAVADQPLLRDHQGRPLLTGATLAGALRSHLADRGVLAGLFGGDKGDENGLPSFLIIDDAVGQAPPIERRDLVRICADSRTAADEAKYDIDLWPAGTVFPLSFELIITAEPDGVKAKPKWLDEQALRDALATALAALAAGEIRLGMRKSRGFGQCRAGEWQVREYDLTTTSGLLAWLEGDTPAAVGDDIAELLGATVAEDRRDRFVLEATCGLDGSLLIRSGSGVEPGAPDMVHLQSWREGVLVPILSGTSLAGALRARAAKIARTLATNPSDAKDLVENLFGPRAGSIGRQNPGWRSKVTVDETVVAEPAAADLVQERVSIDRFTGGARDSALFAQQPVFGDQEQTTVTIKLTVDKPCDAEIGLLLQVLKDLWTSDLPVGGEQSVGRGRLVGRSATLTRTGATRRHWTLTADGQTGVTVTGSPAGELTAYAKALVDTLGGEVATDA